jgi:hypothetical protein
MLAYSVTQRTREIGIRIALGSPRGNIFRLVLRQAMIMVGIGIVVGLYYRNRLRPFVPSLCLRRRPARPSHHFRSSGRVNSHRSAGLLDSSAARHWR